MFTDKKILFFVCSQEKTILSAYERRRADNQPHKLMVKKELSVRERRRIFEDTICIIAKTQKLAVSSRGDRDIASLVKGQMEKCTSIIATSLGYREISIDKLDGGKEKVYAQINEESGKTISKEVFESLVQRLPKEKSLKETMWKAAVKNDKKATAIFDEMVA